MFQLIAGSLWARQQIDSKFERTFDEFHAQVGSHGQKGGFVQCNSQEQGEQIYVPRKKTLDKPNEGW